MITKENLQDSIRCASAGMSNYHIGERANEKSRQAASKRGYDLQSRARQFTQKDFAEFDYILPMDESNYAQLNAMASSDQDRKKIVPFISLCKSFKDKYKDVPDPYYGGMSGFDHVLDVCEEGCIALFESIQKK